MADAQRTIDLIFNGVDRTGAATLSALNNLGKFTGNVQALTQPVADVTGSLVKLEAGVLLAGLAMTTFAVKAAGDFDTNFRQITTIIDAPKEAIDKFRQSILDYASTSTQPLEQITAALSGAIGSGVKYSESLTLLAAAEKLAASTRADLDSTTKVLVSTLNSYGIGMDGVGKLSDTFFGIIDKGDISMNDLAASFAKIAPVASLAGVPIEEIGAAIATLTASGLKPAESIEYLRGAISNILSPSREGKDLAEQLGIAFNGAGLKAQGLAGLIQEVGTKTGGSAAQMKVLFGDIGGFTAAATLAGPQAAKFAENLEAMKNTAGATEAAFNKMAGSVDVAKGKMLAAFTALAVEIGAPLLDEFGGVANAIAAIFTALRNSVKDGALKEIVTYIEGLFGELQTTLNKVAENLPAALENADLSGFAGGIQAVVDAFKRLFGGIDLSTVDGLTRAVELAGAAFLGLSRFTAGVVDSFKPLFDYLVKIGSELSGSETQWAELAGNIGGTVTQFNLLLGGIGGVVPALQALVALMVARQGISLLGAVATLTAAMPGLITVLGLAGAAFAGAFAYEQVYRLIQGLVDLKGAHDKLAESQRTSEVVARNAAGTLERFTETTGLAVKSVDEAMSLVDDGTVVWSDAANGWVKAGDALAAVSEQAKNVDGPIGDANQAMLDAAVAAAAAEDKVGKLSAAQSGLAGFVQKIVPLFDAATGAVIGYEQRLVKASEAGITLKKAAEDVSAPLKTSGDVMEQLAKKTNLSNDELIKLAKNVKDAEIELEKIASNERIKNIEARVTLQVADLEAQTKRVEASFESIDNTVNSTGELLGDLFGALKDYDTLSFRASGLLEDQIDLENERRQQALDMQKELINAQIAQLRAQTQALEKGDSIIKVDGAGLQPHLEAFMFEILRSIQVRVNQDGLKMLLGV